MTKILIAFLCLVLGGVLLTDSAQAAPAPKKPAVAKKATAASSKKATKKRVRASRSRRRGARRVRFVPHQSQPTKDRFTEIQRALSEKGYFTGEPTGVWSAESIEALKRFQDDQSLQASGKINSLSLIALGLGPKRNPIGALPVITPPVAGPEAPRDDAAAEAIEPPAAPPAVAQ